MTSLPRSSHGHAKPRAASATRTISLEGLGFLLGSAVTVALTVELAVWMLANAYHDFNPYSMEPFLKWVTVATPIVGYLAGVTLVVGRTLRRLGLGMLIGLTLALPVPSCLAFAAQLGLWYGLLG